MTRASSTCRFCGIRHRKTSTRLRCLETAFHRELSRVTVLKRRHEFRSVLGNFGYTPRNERERQALMRARLAGPR